MEDEIQEKEAALEQIYRDDILSEELRRWEEEEAIRNDSLEFLGYRKEEIND